MTDVEEIRIVSNKIDKIEDFALPSQNSVKSLILEGNHILEVPSLAALQEIHVEKVTFSPIFQLISSILYSCYVLGSTIFTKFEYNSLYLVIAIFNGSR